MVHYLDYWLHPPADRVVPEDLAVTILIYSRVAGTTLDPRVSVLM
jgi:hypothetical protein